MERMTEAELALVRHSAAMGTLITQQQARGLLQTVSCHMAALAPLAAAEHNVADLQPTDQVVLAVPVGAVQQARELLGVAPKPKTKARARA